MPNSATDWIGRGEGTAKMAELFFNFGRKWQAKNLVSPKKSSTFAASKEKDNKYFNINQIKLQNYEKIYRKPNRKRKN